MMATIAILRQLAPTTGGVRHPCFFCESKGYNKIEENEQREIFDLMSEIKDLRQENCKCEEKRTKLNDEIKKVAKMNREMDDFFDNVVLGPVVAIKLRKDFGIQTHVEESEAKDLANQKEFWKI